MLGAGVSAAGTTYTDCSNIGTAAFYWNGDHASGTTYGCKTSSTSLNGSIAGVKHTITDPPTPSPGSGGKALKLLATGTTDDYLAFAITAGDIFSSAEGLITFNVYLGASTGDNKVIRFRSDANNDIVGHMTSAGVVTFVHLGASSSVGIVGGDAIADTTWTNVQIRWSVTNNKVSVKVGANDWDDDVDADTVTAFATEPTSIRFGFNTITDDVYIDDIFIWKASGI